MSAKTINSTSKIEALIEFAKECDLSRFNKTELHMRTESCVLKLDMGTLYIYGNGIMGSLYIPDICKNYADVIVPNAETTLRNLFAGCEQLATRKRVYDGVDNADALEILKSTKARQVAEAGARCSVILAEFRKLEKITKASEESQNRSKDKSRAQRLYQGAGKKHADGSWREIDGMPVSGGVITELEMSVTEYLQKCRDKKTADRERRIQADKAAQKAKESAAQAA